jgi:N-acetylmuramoyl-L-alanine amidase
MARRTTDIIKTGIIMKLINLCTLILIAITATPMMSRADTVFDIAAQPPLVRNIIDGEKNIELSKGLISTVQILDEMYGNTYERLKKGGKIVIYVDPCHGQVNGSWSARPTGRFSVTGITEELYSLTLIRKLYRHLTSNPNIQVITTDDYHAALKGERDEYNSISFRKTIKNAYDNRAQMIISQHLNNVRYSVKATGTSNIPGIHIIHDRNGGRYLEKITEVYKGFLTLYNRLDVSGFSRHYALGLKEALTGAGLQPNGWQRGAVADDRFIYFIDFPISLIYETGFISNPDDLAKLTDPVMQDRIAKVHYDSLLESMKNVFGVDISGREVAKTEATPSHFDLTLVKLSRIALFYMDQGRAREAVSVIDLMQRNYGSRYGALVQPYLDIKNTALCAENLFVKSQRLLNQRVKGRKQRQKNIRLAASCLARAKSITRSKDFYDGLYDKYNAAYKDIVIPGWRNHRRVENQVPIVAHAQPRTAPAPRKIVDTHYPVTLSDPTRPIIFVYEEHQSLRDALRSTLSPGDDALLDRLHASFTGASVTEKVKAREWSKKKKKNVTVWRSVRKRINFSPGIYVVNLNHRLEVENARRMSRVYLNPDRYQNQLFLKNSFCANASKSKSL